MQHRFEMGYPMILCKSTDSVLIKHINCRGNQLTGFHMMRKIIMNELNEFFFPRNKTLGSRLPKPVYSNETTR